MLNFLFSDAQIQLLNEVFEKNPYPSIEQKEEIAESFNLKIKQINNWFCSRRYKGNKRKKPNISFSYIYKFKNKRKSLEKSINVERVSFSSSVLSSNFNDEKDNFIAILSENYSKILREFIQFQVKN